MAWPSTAACDRIPPPLIPGKRERRGVQPPFPGPTAAEFPAKAEYPERHSFLFKRHDRRKSEKMPLALLDQPLYRGIHVRGRYIVVPMINKYFVWKKRLFSKEELLSMAAHRAIHARSHCRQPLRAGGAPHRRHGRSHLQLPGRHHPAAGHSFHHHRLV